MPNPFSDLSFLIQDVHEANSWVWRYIGFCLEIGSPRIWHRKALYAFLDGDQS